MKKENSKFVFKVFHSTPMTQTSEPCLNHVDKSSISIFSWDLMASQKVSPSLSSTEDQLWMLRSNLMELSIWAEPSRLRKPEERLHPRENLCLAEEETSADKDKDNKDRLKATLKSPPQLCSLEVFLSTPLLTQSNNSSPKPVKSNQPESSLTNKLKR